MDDKYYNALLNEYLLKCINEGLSLEEVLEKIENAYNEKVNERVAWEIGNGTL